MSKFASANEKITEGVVKGYKKIEDGVVDGYKKIETGVVEGFGKMTDKCVEKLFAKEGETVGIANPMLYDIVSGLVGMFMAIINYHVYKGILSARRKKYADRIIAFSDKIMKS